MRWTLALSVLLLGCLDLPDPLEPVPEEEDPFELPLSVLLELPPCEGSVLGAASKEEILPPLAGSQGWLPPEQDTRAAIASSWDALMNGDAPLAVGMVAVVGYALCRGLDSEEDLVLWRPAQAGTGRALLLWRYVDAEPWIIEAPHAFVGPWDADDAVALFQASAARALVVAGTHPCANEGEAACADSVLCAGPAASDATTNAQGILHLGHQLLTRTWPADAVLSLVAMHAPGVSLSDGTQSPADPESALAQLAQALRGALPGEPLTSCGPLEGVTTSARFCGEESVQARASNGAEDACVEATVSPSGRFVQVAASDTVREGTELVEALARAINP